MANSASDLGPRVGVLTPRWIRIGILLNLVGLAVCLYATMAGDFSKGPPLLGGLPVGLILIPSVVLGFWLPRQGARAGVTLHAKGLSLRNDGEARAIALDEVETIRWDGEPPAIVLEAGGEVPLPQWLGSDPKARGGLEHHLRRTASPDR